MTNVFPQVRHTASNAFRFVVGYPARPRRRGGELPPADGRTPNRFASRAALVLVGCCWMVMGASGLSGCGQSAAGRLVGRWEGRPESAEQYQARQQKAQAAAIQSSPPENGPKDSAESRASTKTVKPVVPSSPPFPDPTELERFDVRVVFDFARDGSATMWRDDGRDRFSGTWRVIESSGDRTVVEIVASRAITEPDGNEPDRDGGPLGARTQRRKFVLEWVADGDGFTLVEEGADPQFGWFYFQRQKR